MMIIYNIGIWIYSLIIKLVSPFNEKARLWVKGRKGWKDEIEGIFNPSDRVFWIHCASLGEFEQGRPVIEALKEKDASIKIIVTFFSPSGYEIRKDYEKADHVMYLPADSPGNARFFIEHIAPEAALFVKYEFWFNYLSELQKRTIPHHLISGVFRKNQLFFKWYGRSFLEVLAGFTTLFVQEKESEDLLRRHGIERILVSGDTRFDRVYDISRKSPELEILNDFCGENPTIIAGSTWPSEEDVICKYINHGNGSNKWVIAPHEIGADHILAIENLLNVESVRYSVANKENIIRCKVLIIDNIGILSSVYRYGRFAIIGGGFGRGIHNILEPASWGLPVIFGPNYKKFKEAEEMLLSSAAFSFSDYDSFSGLIDKFLNKQETLSKSSRAASDYVERNLGATAIVIDNIL